MAWHNTNTKRFFDAITCAAFMLGITLCISTMIWGIPTSWLIGTSFIGVSFTASILTN